MPQRYSQGVNPQRNQKKYQQLPFQQARPQHSTESFHKTKLCKFNMEGRCARGPECKFAHSEDQLHEQPDLYRTRLCSAYLRGGRCPRGRECRFAHSEAELRRPSVATSQSDQDLSDTAPELDPDLDHRADSDEISENDGIQWVLWPIPSWNPWSGVLDGSEAMAWDTVGEEEQLAWDPIGQLAWDPIGTEVEKAIVAESLPKEDESKKNPSHHPDCLAGLAALSQRYAGPEKRTRPAPLEDVDNMKFSDFRLRLDSKASTQASSPTTSGKNLFAHGSQSDTQSEGHSEDCLVDFAPKVKNTFLHFEEAGHDTEVFATLAKCRSEPLL